MKYLKMVMMRTMNLEPDFLNVNYFTHTDFWDDRFYPKSTTKPNLQQNCVNCKTPTNCIKGLIFFSSIKRQLLHRNVTLGNITLGNLTFC